MTALRLHLLVLSLVALNAVVSCHNITDILSGFSDYSEFNKYMSETKLADDVNSRQTLTVLVLNNAAMVALAAKHPISVVKQILSLHVVLDYYDPQKLHKLPDDSTLTTTLYQTTGNAPGNQGFVNITDFGAGKVCFGSAVAGSKLNSAYTKSVKQVPYTISVLEVTEPIVAPAILSAPALSASDVNITAALVKAGCKTFAALISSSGVVKTYESAAAKGLTLFAPNDEAFKAAGVPDLSKLTSVELVSLLLYHSSAGYAPKGTLKTTKDPLTTLATSGAGKFEIRVTTAGDDVTLHSGVAPSRLADTIVDSTPLVIFSVDSVLLPEELFGKSPSPAPAPAPVEAPTPTPASAPAPMAASPPAPPTETPEEAPADAPTAKSANAKAANGAADLARSRVKAALLAAALAAVVLS